MRCAKCGRRVAVYLNEVSGPYLAHVWPALHRARLADPKPIGGL